MGVRSLPVVISLLLSRALGGTLKTCTSESGSVSPCVASDVAADDGSLIQKVFHRRTAQSGQQQQQQEAAREAFFPDFSKEFDQIASLAKRIPVLDNLTHMAAKVQGVFQDAAESSVDALGEQATISLKALADEATRFELAVNESNGDVASGVASVLARVLNVSVDAIPVGPEYEKVAAVALTKAVVTWSTLETSARSATLVLATGLAAVGLQDAANSFNSTMQAALQSGASFMQSVGLVQSLMTNTTAGSVELLANSAGYVGRDLLDKLGRALHTAKVAVESFPVFFHDAFSTLEEQVATLLKTKLGRDVSATARKSLEKAKVQADVTAATVTRSSLTLLSGMISGLDSASQHVRSRAGSLAPNVALISAAVLLLSTVVGH